MKFCKKLALCIVLLLITLIIEQYSNIDTSIENIFYNFSLQQWFITPEQHIKLDFIFYNGMKHFVAFIGTLCVLYILISIWKKDWRIRNQGVLTVLLSTMLIPLSVSYLKKITNIYCPNQLDIYNSIVPYVRILEHYPSTFNPTTHGRCFPAGHASGLFSLMSLYFAFFDRKKQLIALSSAFTIGWIGGTYQMLRGEHFFTHTIFTMLWAAILILLINKLVIRIFRYVKSVQNKKA